MSERQRGLRPLELGVADGREVARRALGRAPRSRSRSACASSPSAAAPRPRRPRRRRRARRRPPALGVGRRLGASATASARGLDVLLEVLPLLAERRGVGEARRRRRSTARMQIGIEDQLRRLVRAVRVVVVVRRRAPWSSCVLEGDGAASPWARRSSSPSCWTSWRRRATVARRARRGPRGARRRPRRAARRRTSGTSPAPCRPR